MKIYNIYLFFILLIFILIYYGLNFSYKYAPFKIKILSLGALIILGFRYIALLLFLISKNIKYIYLFKPLVFFNILSIPILALISIYINARNDKFKFNYCIAASAILAILYTVVIIKFPAKISSIGELGYVMTFFDGSLVYGIFLILNTMFLFIAIFLLDYKNINILGIWLVLLSTIIQIIELIIRLSGIFIFPAIIIGDICFLISENYALYKLKK